MAPGRPTRLSRSKIDRFLECPRCFYRDRQLRVDRPKPFPYTLNNAVDLLLKREFDGYREASSPHPLMTSHGLDAVPFKDERLEAWRDALHRGIRYVHEPTQFEVTGGIDDVWGTPGGELIIVDYKATARANEDGETPTVWPSWQRQAEVYQWLFRQNGFSVSDTAYFVHANGDVRAPEFGGTLSFAMSLVPYEGSDAWVEQALLDIRQLLNSGAMPQAAAECQYCSYIEKAAPYEASSPSSRVSPT